MKYAIAILLILSIIFDGLSDGFFFREVKQNLGKWSYEVTKSIHLVCLVAGFYIAGMLENNTGSLLYIFSVDLKMFVNYVFGYIAIRFFLFDPMWNIAAAEPINYRGVKGLWAKFLNNQPRWLLIVASLFAIAMGLIMWDII